MNNLNTAIRFALLFSASGMATAKPAALNIGGVPVLPSLKTEQIYNSNILYSETDEKSSLISIIAPFVQMGKQNGVNLYTLQAGLQAGFYANSSADNYFDSQIQGDIHHEFTRRNQIDLTAQYSKAHDARGTGYNQGRSNTINKPDRYYTWQAGGSYTYGTKDATGRIKIMANTRTKIYENNRSLTAGRDRDNLNVGTTFFLNIQPRTALLMELRHSQISYKTSTLALDNNENRIFAGAEWDISNITTGSVRGGLLQKNFDNAARENSEGFSWEVSVEWMPLTYSKFTFQTTGKADEAYGIDDFIDSKMAMLGWAHNWNNQVSTNLDTLVVKNNYNPSSKEEGIVSVSTAIYYEMRRWLTLSLKVGHSQRLSNRALQDYKKNEVSVNVLVTL